MAGTKCVGCRSELQFFPFNKCGWGINIQHILLFIRKEEGGRTLILPIERKMWIIYKVFHNLCYNGWYDKLYL